jgi:hypothetical protein
MLSRFVPLLLCALPLAARAEVTSLKPETVVHAIQAAGYKAEVGRGNDGRMLIESTASGWKFNVFFWGCTDGKDCDQIQLSARFIPRSKPPFETLNQWNVEKSFTKAMADKQGNPELVWEIDLKEPVSDAYFKRVLSVWDASLGLFGASVMSPAATSATAPGAPATLEPAAPARTAVAAAVAAASAAGAPEKLTGVAAWTQLVGNSITGQEDNKPLVEYYGPDGIVRSRTGNALSRGTWTLTGEAVCFKFPGEKMECYKLEVAGNMATFIDNKGSGSRYEILKGNARGL